LESFQKVKKNGPTNLNVQAFTYENVRRQVKRPTLKHWHGRLGTFPLGYQINASWVTKWPLYSDCVNRGNMVE